MDEVGKFVVMMWWFMVVVCVTLVWILCGLLVGIQVGLPCGGVKEEADEIHVDDFLGHWSRPAKETGKASLVDKNIFL